VAKDLAWRGFAVWNLEYRREGDTRGGWPATLDDVATGINHLASLVDTGIYMDLEQVVVVGHSAGGQLALWAGAGRTRTARSLSVRVQVIAVAGLAPVTDLADAFHFGSGNESVSAFIGGSPQQFPDRYQMASPMQLLPIGID
jgi:acetyl esterase/lipase